MRAAIGLVIAMLLLGACSLLPSAQPGTYDIHVDNGTDVDVLIFVNGRQAGGAAAHDAVTLPAEAGGPLPWRLEARTATSGRQLLAFDVQAGTVDIDGSSQRGSGGRADLSCGRLDVFVGPPMMGPAPGPGVPGDCAP